MEVWLALRSIPTDREFHKKGAESAGVGQKECSNCQIEINDFKMVFFGMRFFNLCTHVQCGRDIGVYKDCRRGETESVKEWQLHCPLLFLALSACFNPSLVGGVWAVSTLAPVRTCSVLLFARSC